VRHFATGTPPGPNLMRSVAFTGRRIRVDITDRRKYGHSER